MIAVSSILTQNYTKEGSSALPPLLMWTEQIGMKAGMKGANGSGLEFSVGGRACETLHEET